MIDIAGCNFCKEFAVSDAAFGYLGFLSRSGYLRGMGKSIVGV
jgi:hypothetical protein